VFFLTYLRRELRRRMRQAIFIALGLALGVGLVVTVAAASAGVNKAQSKVLSALYGVATDVTVTGAVSKPSAGGAPPKGVGEIQEGPHGPEFCVVGGTCTSAAGKTQNEMNSLDDGISQSKVAEVARLRGVAATAGGITLSDSTVSFPKSGAFSPRMGGYTLDGLDTRDTALGPLSSASLKSGHSFTAADVDAHAAVVDSGYAKSNMLKSGSALTIDGIKFTVIGIVQAQGSNPADIYVPLKAAQDLPLQADSLKNEVNTIYVTAASSASIPAVTKEISDLLPGTEVTSTSGLASEVTGSVTSAAKLADDLGRWLAVLVLIAAFAVASLLTVAAVARRVAEFGTLKALGWRTRRIVGQVLGESVAVGVAGAVAGVGLGFAGMAVISAFASKVSATVGANTVPGSSDAGLHLIGGSPVQTVAVPLNPSITVGVIVLAVLLAVAGGLLAGALGAWRIARLRPADALARVA
jgi:putative ABC transport system permease protein